MDCIGDFSLSTCYGLLIDLLIQEHLDCISLRKDTIIFIEKYFIAFF